MRAPLRRNGRARDVEGSRLRKGVLTGSRRWSATGGAASSLTSCPRRLARRYRCDPGAGIRSESRRRPALHHHRLARRRMPRCSGRALSRDAAYQRRAPPAVGVGHARTQRCMGSGVGSGRARASHPPSQPLHRQPSRVSVTASACHFSASTSRGAYLAVVALCRHPVLHTCRELLEGLHTCQSQNGRSHGKLARWRRAHTATRGACGEPCLCALCPFQL